jgi:tRNA(Ile)-lysidine synthase
VQAARAEFRLKPNFAALQGVGRIAVAVSGGSDSMAMLRLLLEWSKAQSNPPFISVLTVDHGLRAESAAEAMTVARWCQALGVEHVVLVWTGEKPVSGIQAKARAARYELMTQWCSGANVPVLLTAHTLDDQNETVVMRQKRTMSVRSLAGIWPAREWNGIRILRPILDLRREALRRYLGEQGQEWLDDPSNENRRFERVRLRQEMAGRADDPGAVAGVAQAQVLQADLVARQFVDRNVAISDVGVLTCVAADFVKLAPLEADAILVRLLKLTGRRAPPEREHRLNLLAWLSGGEVGRRTLGGAVFAKRKASLTVAREAGRIDPSPVVIPASGQIIWDGRFRVTGPSGSMILPLLAWGDVPHQDLPQFVRLGLPAAVIGGKLAFVPQLQPNHLFNYEFIKDDARR